MLTSRLIVWVRENLSAIAALTVTCLAAFIVGEASLLLIPVAFAVGFLLQPRLLWPLWLWTLGIILVGNGVNAIIDPEWWSDTGETVVSVFFESLIFLTGLVLLPLWLGRASARAFGRRRAV